jgi:hypothetical protein
VGSGLYIQFTWTINKRKQLQNNMGVYISVDFPQLFSFLPACHRHARTHAHITHTRCTHAHTLRIHIHVYAYAHEYVHASTHTCTHVHERAHTCTHIHTHMHVSVHTYTRTYITSCMHTRTHHARPLGSISAKVSFCGAHLQTGNHIWTNFAPTKYRATRFT